MNSGILIAALSLALGFSVSTAQAQSADGQARTIQGYATGCASYIFGTSVIKVNLYLTAADALASKTSPMRPQTDVVVDVGPGWTIANLNKDSSVRLICAALMGQNGEKPVVIRTNAQNVLVSVDVYGQTIQSDAYVLMPEADQKRIASVVKAYIAKDWELANLREEKAKTETK